MNNGNDENIIKYDIIVYLGLIKRGYFEWMQIEVVK